MKSKSRFFKDLWYFPPIWMQPILVLPPSTYWNWKSAFVFEAVFYNLLNDFHHQVVTDAYSSFSEKSTFSWSSRIIIRPWSEDVCLCERQTNLFPMKRIFRTPKKKGTPLENYVLRVLVIRVKETHVWIHSFCCDSNICTHRIMDLCFCAKSFLLLLCNVLSLGNAMRFECKYKYWHIIIVVL